MEDMNCKAATTYMLQKNTEALDIVAPVETKELKSMHNNTWLTQGISISLAKQQELFNDYKRANSDSTKERYNLYNKIMNEVIGKAKAMDTENIVNKAGTDSQKLWSILYEVVDRKQLKHKIPANFQVHGSTLMVTKEIADAFNNYFAKIGKDMAETIPQTEGIW